MYYNDIVSSEDAWTIKHTCEFLWPKIKSGGACLSLSIS